VNCSPSLDHAAGLFPGPSLDIGDIFAAAIAFPRQTAAEPELAAEADGDDGANVGELPSVHGISLETRSSQQPEKEAELGRTNNAWQLTD
jgi:hypothetical protein